MQVSIVGTAAVIVACAVGMASAHAQQYPVRPITVVVPFAPGGISDITMRPLAPALSRILGQNVIVENRPGAGGAVGNAQVARSKPDGYTLLMTLSSLLVIPESEKIAGREPSYQVAQLAPIARVSADPLVLLVRTESTWKTAGELAADVRARPGKITYSSSGLYGATHIPIEMFAQAAGGLRMIHVPYQGGGPAMTALIAGQVDVTGSAPGVASPHIKAGKARPIGVFSAQRIPALPDVPTFREQGLNAEFYIWSGLFAPADTPAEIMTRLRSAVREAVDDAGFKQAMVGMGQPVGYLDAPDFQRFMEVDGARLATAVQKMGKLE